MWGWIREHIVRAIILAALSASLVAYFEGVFDKIIGDVLPKGAEISCVGREWAADYWPFRQPETPPDIFRILIATLAGDDDSGTQTEAVERALQGQNAIDAVLTCRVLYIQGAGYTAEAATAKTGLEWLARRKADVLIFGEVLSKGEALNLHFLTSGWKPNFAATPFRLESGLLRDEFKEAAAAQLQAVALAAVSPATDEEGKYLAETLRPVVLRLKRIAESPPPGLSSASRHSSTISGGRSTSSASRR